MQVGGGGRGGRVHVGDSGGRRFVGGGWFRVGPDLNPIEQLFARLKAFVLPRTAAARSAINNREIIIQLAARHRLPAIYPYRVFAADGGLMVYTYTMNGYDLLQRAASYVDRITSRAPFGSAANASISRSMSAALRTIVLTVAAVRSPSSRLPPRCRSPPRARSMTASTRIFQGYGANRSGSAINGIKQNRSAARRSHRSRPSTKRSSRRAWRIYRPAGRATMRRRAACRSRCHGS
jgi:hypothetical protein